MTTLAELILKADYRQVTQADKALDGLASTGSKAAGSMRSLAATLGAAFGIKEVLQAADAYVNFTNRLKLVTDSSIQLAQAQEQIFRIAQDTRQPLEATATVYQRLAQNADVLGISLQDVGNITETVNKLVAMSGASAEAANAALVQLGQGLASGALRGEELNSVMEQTPALANAIAEGMGITIGQLRAMGQEGKITSEVLIKALEKQADSVNEQFNKMAPTLSQAMTQVGNSFTRLVGRVDEVTGSTNSLGSSISDISRAMDDLDLSGVTRLWATWGNAIGNASDDAKQLNRMIGNTGRVVSAVSDAFISLPSNITAFFRIAGVEVADFVESVSGRLERAGSRWKAIFQPALTGGETWDKANAKFEADEKRRDAVRLESIATILAQRDAELALGRVRADANALFDEFMGGGNDQLTTKGDPKKTGVVDKEAEEKRRKEKERLEEQALENEIYWSNQITQEMDAIARSAEAENLAYADKLARLQQQFGTEQELEAIAYAQKLEDFRAYSEMMGLSEEEARLKREQFAEEHAERMRAIQLKEIIGDKNGMSKKLGNTQKYLSDMYNASGAHSNKMLKMIQTVGAAEALANAYIGASQALADPTVPFFSKFAAVAQVVATGMGLVNAIKSGSGGVSSGGGASSAPSADTSSIQAQQPARNQIVDFRIERRGRRGWDDEDVAELMMAMGERVKDGASFGRVEFVTR